jgi:hypothetical protein
MTRAQDTVAASPLPGETPPVAGHTPPVFGQMPLVVIPSPGVPKTRRFCALWGGNPAAIWTGTRSGWGTPVECRGFFRHSETVESTRLQTPEDLLFSDLKSEISDLPFLPFSLAAKQVGTKARRMKLLRSHNTNRPGMILLQETRIATNHPARIATLCDCKSFITCSLWEYRILKDEGAKGLRMILLCKGKNNCPGLILLQKKGGRVSGMSNL